MKLAYKREPLSKTEPKGSGMCKKPGNTPLLGEMLLLVSAILVAIIAVELGLRVSYRLEQLQPAAVTNQPQQDSAWKFFQYDSTLGWRNRPDAEGTFKIPDSVTSVKINSQGVRDREHRFEKPGRFRILALGDSFTWGFGVEQNERFTDKLQSLVGEPIEVINAGVTGWGTDQELLYWTQEGYRYHPDLVLVAFGTEDIINNAHSVQHGYPKPYFLLRENHLVLRNSPVPKKTGDWAKHLGLPEELRVKPVEADESRGEINAFLQTHVLSHSWLWARGRDFLHDREMANKGVDRLTEALLLALQQRVQSHEAKLVVVMVPYKNHIRPGASANDLRQWDAIVKFFRSHGFDCVDLRPAFVKESTAGKQLHFAIDDHWNPTGHELAAKVIYEHLTEKHILPSTP